MTYFRPGTLAPLKISTLRGAYRGLASPWGLELDIMDCRPFAITNKNLSRVFDLIHFDAFE